MAQPRTHLERLRARDAYLSPETMVVASHGVGFTMWELGHAAFRPFGVVCGEIDQNSVIVADRTWQLRPNVPALGRPRRRRDATVPEYV